MSLGRVLQHTGQFSGKDAENADAAIKASMGYVTSPSAVALAGLLAIGERALWTTLDNCMSLSTVP